MILKSFPVKGGDAALYLMKSVKHKGDKYPKKEAVEFFGYLSNLKKIYDDPIAHFKQVAEERTKEYKALKAQGKHIAINVDLNTHVDLSKADDNIPYGDFLWMGQMPLLRLYYELELDKFLARRKRSWGIKKGMEVILKLLIIGRIIVPQSKLGTWRELEHFKLGNNKPSDDDIYNALEFIGNSSQDMLTHLNEVITRKFGRDSSLMYYDVTNYYCEIDNPDNIIDGGLRIKGVSKEHKPEPIIQMGLFMDRNGLPVTFGLFPGNNNDVTTFIPMIKKVEEDYSMKKMIYIADKGMMSGDNIAHILLKGNGYVISDSPRKKQNADLMDFLFDENGYISIGDDDFKYKSRIVPIHKSNITYQGNDKKTCTISYNERQIIFWSKKYAIRAKEQRLEALEKVLQNPKVFDDYKVKAFIDKIPYNSKTGKMEDELEFELCLNQEKLREAERLDGYYIIRTNVIGTEEDEKEWEGECRFRKDYLFQLNKIVSDLDIIDMYRGLWEIEETFKITKSFLSTRPVFVRKESSIKAHFLTCFIALLMVRLLEKKTNHRINHSDIINALKKSIVAPIDNGVYKNIITSRAMREIGLSMGMDLTKQWYTAEEIKSLAAKPKEV